MNYTEATIISSWLDDKTQLELCAIYDHELDSSFFRVTKVINSNVAIKANFDTRSQALEYFKSLDKKTSNIT